MKNTFSLNLFTYLLAYLLTSLKKIFFSGSTNETFFTPEHFIFFFSVGFTHEHFSFLHEKRFIPELYFIFKIVFFELKSEKKA